MATAALQKHVECPVCFEVFCNPHILQCLHTYCLECLESLQKANRTIECPECRKITHFKDIKKDFRAEGMVDSFAQLEKGLLKDMNSLHLHATPSTMKCVCTNASKPVVGHCDDCEEYLCADCKAAHEKLKVTRTHKIRSMAHMITTLKHDLNKVRDKVHKEVMEIDQMSAAIENISSDKKNRLDEVNQFLDSLVEAIENHRKNLVNKITEGDIYLLKKLSAKRDKLKSNRLVLQSWLEYLGSVMKSGDVAILSNAINLHGNTLTGISGEIVEIRNEVAEMNIANKSGMRLVKNDDMIDLKSIINVEIEKGFKVAHLEVTDEKPNGFHDLINCKYKQIIPEFHNTNSDYMGCSASMSLINDQFWCGLVNGIAIFDKDRNIVKKISYQQLDLVLGISYTQRGDVIASCTNGLHQLDSSGNYVRKVKRGIFGRSFAVGEEVYVVNVQNFTVLTLKHLNGQWKSVSEINLPFDDDNDILVKESGIFICSNKNRCIYHYSLSGDLQQQVDISQPRGSSMPPYLIRLLGVDAYGNMLISYVVDSKYKVQVFTSGKQWFDVPFLAKLLAEEIIERFWCQGDELFVYYDCSILLRFKKE